MDKQALIEALRQIEKEKEDKKLKAQNKVRKMLFLWLVGNGVAIIAFLIWFSNSVM